MSLLRAELLKLRTTRAVIGYLLVLVVLTGITAAAQASAAHVFQLDDPAFQRDLLSQSVAAPLIALMLGILSFTVEWRHGTITRTFLVTPRRWRVLAAKEINAFVLGIAVAVLAIGVALAVAAPLLSRDGAALDVNGPLLGRMGEIVVAVALWGALGAAVGGLIQNQTAAIVGAVIWIVVIEALVTALLTWANLDGIAQALPGRALGALDGHQEGLPAGAGGAVGLAYVAFFAALASLRIRRQDIT